MRVDPAEFRALPLAVHALLHDVPLRDVSAVDLPGGGAGRSLLDVRALAPSDMSRTGNLVTRALFGLRFWLGRLFGWDAAHAPAQAGSLRARVGADLAARSLLPPGSREGFFELFYALPDEMLLEARNATVHAFLVTALAARPGGYRLYWAVYVKPVSWLTPVYMAAIEPFRRFVVYPSLLGQVRRRWVERYGAAQTATGANAITL